MRGEGVEIRSYGAHVDFFVGYGLSAVYADHGATAMGIGGYLGYGIDGAENIRHLRDRHQAGARREERAIGIEVEYSALVAGYNLDYYASTRSEELPGYNVWNDAP